MSEPVVVLTGGTGQLGTALAGRLLDAGARIAVTYFIPSEAEDFENAFGSDEERILLKRVDSTAPDQLDGFMAAVNERFGGFDALACLTGGWAGGSVIAETDDLRLERMLDLNLRSSFNAVRAAAPHLVQREWGRIVLVGSTAVFDAPIGQAAFNIAKAGVVALGRSAANELGPDGVTVNVVMPSVIDTPATRETLPFADYVDWPSADEIAALVEFLLREDAGAVNGSVIEARGRT